jgi:hypothetical protein
MRFRGAGALRCIKSEEVTPAERMTANEWGSQPALSARSGQIAKWKTVAQRSR